MSDLYASPDALRSPLTTTRRINQQDNTPVSNVSRIFTWNTVEVNFSIFCSRDIKKTDH